MYKLSISLSVFLLLSGCNGSDKDESTSASPDTGISDAVEVTTPEVTTPEVTTPEVTTPEVTTPEVTTPEVTTPEEVDGDIQRLSSPFVSPSTVETETAFSDSFVSDAIADISWSGPSVGSPTSVDSIASAFNVARAADSTVNEKLRMPIQAVWDSYDTSTKTLYLINSERSARGMRPFPGIAPELVNSAELYSAELSDNGEFSHNYGTYPNPTARLAGWASVVAPPQTALPTGNENVTYNSYYIEELIAYVETSDSSIYEAEARAIYRFMYQDKSPAYGDAYAHRNIILAKNPASAALPAAIASSNVSALIGASYTEGMVSGLKRNTFVVHAIDPDTDNWDFSNVMDAPDLIGPELASDCLSGTFVESDDGAGNNTSVCE